MVTVTETAEKAGPATAWSDAAEAGSARETTLRLLAYCREHGWAGYDPYDALNSRFFDLAPFLNSKTVRLAFTQILKRSPINVRPALLIPRTQNAKALGLFLAALVKLDRLRLLADRDLVGAMLENLDRLRSPGLSHWCWGYSFPWQTRTIVVPRGAPNLVCTTFVAEALLDTYEYGGDARALAMARSAAEYVLEELYWTEGDSVAGFSYPVPSVRARIHNSNFLGSALLCRVARLTGDGKFVEPALRVARYSASRQREDGSWDYGELPTQRWIDNFHTGYNLCGLRAICRSADTSEFEPHIRRGFDFYRRCFFREDGAPGYFHDRTHPIDSHCVAQSIITLLEFKDLAADSVPRARGVLRWAMDHMWDTRGFFYYRHLGCCAIKTSYMRWVQAWMLLALVTVMEEDKADDGVKQ